MANTLILPIGGGIQKRGDTLVGFDFQRTVDSVPTDLTGVDIRIDFRLLNVPNKVKRFGIGTGITIVNAATGWARFDDILRLDWNVGLWLADIEYTLTDGTRYSDWNIQLTVKNDITGR